MVVDMKFKATPSFLKLEKEYAGMPSRLESAIVKALGSAGEEVKKYALKDSKMPKWRGKLVASILVIEDGKRKVRVGPNKAIAPYGRAIEYGTKKSTPPWSQIKKWAESKGIPAWPVYRKLRMKGITANPFLQRAFAGSKSAVNNRFEVALERALRESS